jgi:hypothetical protein
MRESRWTLLGIQIIDQVMNRDKARHGLNQRHIEIGAMEDIRPPFTDDFREPVLLLNRIEGKIFRKRHIAEIRLVNDPGILLVYEENVLIPPIYRGKVYQEIS